MLSRGAAGGGKGRRGGAWWDGAEWYDWLAGRVETVDGCGDDYYESAVEGMLVGTRADAISGERVMP